jgi:hypothetical protein
MNISVLFKDKPFMLFMIGLCLALPLTYFTHGTPYSDLPTLWQMIVCALASIYLISVGAFRK